MGWSYEHNGMIMPSAIELGALLAAHQACFVLLLLMLVYHSLPVDRCSPGVWNSSRALVGGGAVFLD